MFVYLIFSFLFNPSAKVKNINPRCNIICENIEDSLVPPSGGELKLLTHLNVENWAYNWISMISDEQTGFYDEHFYLNLFYMRGMTNMYTSPEYFYIAFFPDAKFSSLGPRYIGLFYLETSNRIINTKLIIENPHYIGDDSTILNFRNSIIELTDSADVFFNFKELDRPGQLRYYYSWYYN